MVFRHAKHGLVGALDADDAKRIQALVPQAQYVQIPANHVINRYQAQAFNQALVDFAVQNGIVQARPPQPNPV